MVVTVSVGANGDGEADSVTLREGEVLGELEGEGAREDVVQGEGVASWVVVSLAQGVAEAGAELEGRGEEEDSPESEAGAEGVEMGQDVTVAVELCSCDPVDCPLTLALGEAV